MATRSTSTRSRTTGTKRAPRRTAAASSSSSTMQSLANNTRKAVRSTRARAARTIPTDRTSLSIAAGVVAGLVAAGVAIFMNRDRLRSAASTGGEKLKKAADDLSTMAHDRIDQARDNISKFRQRTTTGSDSDDEGGMPAQSDVAATG
jgi:hypothetical protein